MAVEWGRVFDAYGIKTVTKTDKEKGAYVLSKEQRHAVESAGILPAEIKPAPSFDVTVLFDRSIRSVDASYYHAERVGAGRPVEPRMGHAFISRWLRIGDRVLLGSIGSQLFAIKLPSDLPETDFVVREVVGRASRETVFGHAAKANGKPTRRLVQREDFVRNPWVVQAALLRANDKCEMPDCRSALFRRDDGSLYLEVHHLTPLSEGGVDSISNVAALCPSCHRELHSGENRLVKRMLLAAYIGGL